MSLEVKKLNKRQAIELIRKMALKRFMGQGKEILAKKLADLYTIAYEDMDRDLLNRRLINFTNGEYELTKSGADIES